MRQIPLVESQSPVTLQLPVLTPQMKKQWANFRLPDGNVANYLVTIDSRNRSLVQTFQFRLGTEWKAASQLYDRNTRRKILEHVDSGYAEHGNIQFKWINPFDYLRDPKYTKPQ